MKSDKPNDGSGKTYWNRIKKKGESWTKLRDESKKGKVKHADNA